MGIYGKIFAAFYDRAMAASEEAGLRQMRIDLLAQAEGTVLEIGAGTGANIRLYGGAVEKLILAEPEIPMIKRLRSAASESKLPCEVVEASAESLSVADASVNTVVSTVVLCTVESPAKSLAEIARVLKPGGKFLFLEHVRSDDPKFAKWQDRLNWLWKKCGNGCNSNRRTLELIDNSSLQIVDIQKGSIPKANPLVRPCVTGRATRSAAQTEQA